MGRFLNADAFASTGQGILGNNMFAYCGNNPVARKDPDGQEWVYILDEVETTEIEDDEEDQTTYETRITYKSYERYWKPWSWHQSTPKTVEVTLTFSVSNAGAISFNNSQNNAESLEIECVREALAQEMYDQCTTQVTGSLSRRTPTGIANELYWHYYCYDHNIRYNSAIVASIGGLDSNMPDYDDNGWIFEYS